MSDAAAPLKATFFTLQQRDRAVLLPATLVMITLVILIVAAFVTLNWGFFAQAFSLFQRGGMDMPDEQAAAFAMRMMTLFFSVFLFLFPLYMVLAAYEAACLRWMIRGEVPGLSGFALDHDMWRVYGVYWCWLIVQFAVSFAVSIITMPFMLMSMGDIMNDPTPEAVWDWQWRVQIPLSLLHYVPLIYLSVRFAPAAAASIARKRFAFLDAWTVTRGRFWELFGSFALLMLGFIVGYIVIAGGFTVLVYGPAVIEIYASFPNIDAAQVERALAQAFSARGIAMAGATYFVIMLLATAYALLTFGVNARAAMAALEEGKLSVYAET